MTPTEPTPDTSLPTPRPSSSTLGDKNRRDQTGVSASGVPLPGPRGRKFEGVGRGDVVNLAPVIVVIFSVITNWSDNARCQILRERVGNRTRQEFYRDPITVVLTVYPRDKLSFSSDSQVLS